MDPISYQFWEEFRAQSASDWRNQAKLEIKSPKQIEDFEWISEEGIRWHPNYHAEDIQRPEISWIQASQLKRHWTPSKTLGRVIWHPKIGKELLEMSQRGIRTWYIELVGDLPDAITLQKSLDSFSLTNHSVFWQTIEPDTLYKRIKMFHPYPLKGGILQCSQDQEPATFTRSWFSGLPLAQAGAQAVHELSYILNEWTSTGGISVLEYSLQTNFFLDIAKGRALRYLASRMAEEEQVAMPLLIGSFNPYYLTQKSPSTNQLRCTTATLAAQVGGADACWIPVWNDTARLSYQIPLLLEEEGYLNQVVDPSKGSYFIEHLTLSLVEAVDAHMQSLTGREDVAYWQALADEAHQKRIAQNPPLIGSTVFPSPEAPFSEWTFPRWTSPFIIRHLEPRDHT